MGQKVGKAVFSDKLAPFVNLPGATIERMHQGFLTNQLEWGLSSVQVTLLCAPIGGELALNTKQMEEASRELFCIFDTDSNDLIDGFEMLGTLAMLSGMSTVDKVGVLWGDVGCAWRAWHVRLYKRTRHALWVQAVGTGCCLRLLSTSGGHGSPPRTHSPSSALCLFWWRVPSRSADHQAHS